MFRPSSAARGPIFRASLIALTLGIAVLVVALPSRHWPVRLWPVSHAQKANENDNEAFGASRKFVKQADKTASLEAFANDASGAVCHSEIQ